MILTPRKKFDKYVIGRRREGCEYREVYHAKYKGSKVVLTVYDLMQTPSTLLTDDIETVDHKKLPREAWVLSNVKGDMFPHLIDTGIAIEDGREIAFMAQKYFPPFNITAKNGGQGCRNRDIVKKMSDLINAVQEVAEVCNGGHFNICPQTVKEDVDENGCFTLYLSGLDHAGKCYNGSPWLDTKTLNNCYRPPESYYGIFNKTTDVYALGMLMAYLFTGEYPYPINEKMTMKDVRFSVMKSKPSLDGVPEDFQPLIIRAIAQRSSQRFSNVTELANEFNNIIGENKVSSNSNNTPSDNKNMEENNQQQAVHSVAFKKNIGARNGKGFEAVAGMESLKRTLTTDFVDIVKNQNLAKTLGITPPNMILYGPPGNGKTYIIERLAEECGMAYCYIQPSSLGSIYIHGSQTMIANLFAEAEKKAKKNKKGCMLLIDEIDAVCPQRTNDTTNYQVGEVAEFLTQLNNCIEKNVYVVGTTNRISSVDRAILRAGRIDRIIYIGLPDLDCRKQLFDYEIKKRPHTSGIDTSTLAKQTEGYTAADITKIVNMSSRIIFREYLNNKRVKPMITQECIEQSIRECQPSVTKNEIIEYEHQRNEFATGGMTVRKKIGFKQQP